MKYKPGQRIYCKNEIQEYSPGLIRKGGSYIIKHVGLHFVVISTEEDGTYLCLPHKRIQSNFDIVE